MKKKETKLVTSTMRTKHNILHAVYMAAVITLVMGCGSAYAASDPLAVINNLSSFIVKVNFIILLSFQHFKSSNITYSESP